MCNCNTVYDGSNGSYTYAILGVLCPSCEGEMYDAEMLDQWNALTPREQIAVRWDNARSRVSYSWQRRPMDKIRGLPF